MGALTELLPLILFFAAFKIFGIFAATGVAMGIVALQIATRLVRKQTVGPMLWTTGVVVAVFGGATLLFRDETFIKWKPTVIYWCMALGLSIGHVGFKKNFVRQALGKTFEAPDGIWVRVLVAWVAFLLLLGGLNLYVAYYFSTDTWATYKVFGTMLLMMVFLGIQTALMWRYAKQA